MDIQKKCSCGPKYHQASCVIPAQILTPDDLFLVKQLGINQKVVYYFQSADQMQRFPEEHRRAYTPCPK